MYYPTMILFEGNTLKLTFKEKQMITNWFIDVFELNDKSAVLNATLLYDYNTDGKTAKDWHNKCKDKCYTFSIIESQFNGHIFGCFCSKSMYNDDGATAWIADKNAFLCVIRSCFTNFDKPQIFRIKSDRSNLAFFYDLSQGPTFGSDDLTLLGPENYVHHAMSCFDGAIDGNRLCGGIQYNGDNTEYKFFIQEMNTFTILFCRK